MRGALLTEFGGPLTVTDLRIDEPRGREVLVRVRASGLCHSDHLASSVESGWPLPMLLGHEVAGEVVATGPLVQGLEAGARVVACEVRHCGHCLDCRRGRPWRCRSLDETLRGPDEPPRVTTPEGAPVSVFSHIGGFAEYVLLHEQSLVRIPDELPYELAAVLGCGVATGAGAAINTAGVRVGDTVAVFGCGGVGLSAVWGAAFAGARRVIAVDIVPSKLELASQFGATHVIDSRGTDPVARIRELTDGLGVDHAFEVAGRLETMRQSIDAARATGTAFLIGIQNPASTIELNPFHDLLMAKKSVHAVYMGTSTPAVDLPLYAEAYLQGRFPLDRLVARTVTLDEASDALHDMATGELARTVMTL